jgi:hypothetical protein
MNVKKHQHNHGALNRRQPFANGTALPSLILSNRDVVSRLQLNMPRKELRKSHSISWIFSGIKLAVFVVRRSSSRRTSSGDDNNNKKKWKIKGRL